MCPLEMRLIVLLLALTSVGRCEQTRSMSSLSDKYSFSIDDSNNAIPQERSE